MHNLRLMLLLSCLVGMALAPGAARAQDTPPLELTATYTSADGALTFQYPGGWVTQDSGPAAVLATDEAALETGSELGRGQMRATIFAAPLASLPDLSPDATLEDVLALATTASFAATCEPFSEPAALELDGREALRADQTCSVTESMFVVVRLDEANVAVVGGSTLLGSMSKFRNTLIAVAGTIQYQGEAGAAQDVEVDTSVLSETYVSENGALTFDYPAKWRVEEQNGLIGITDGDQPVLPNPSPGQITIVLLVYLDGEIPPEASGSPADVARWFTAGSSVGIPYREPESFTINDREAARALLDTNRFDSEILVVPMEGGGHAIFNVLVETGQLRQIEPLLHALALTVRYQPPGAPGVEATEDATEAAAEPPIEPTTAPTEPPTGAPTLAPTTPPTEAPTSTATAEPAIEPAATPVETEVVIEATAEVTETAGIDLAQTYTASDGSFSFRYPAGWRAFEETLQGIDYLIVSPVEEFVFGIPQPGAPFGIILVGSVSEVTGAALAGDAAQRPVDAMRALVAASPEVPFGEPEGVSANGRPGARTDAAYDQFDNSAFIVMMNDDDYAYMNVFSAEGEMAEVEPVVVAILASFEPGDGSRNG